MNASKKLLMLCEEVKESPVSAFSKTKRPRNLTQYAIQGLQDAATTKTREALEPGIYKILNTIQGIKFQKHFLDTDTLLRFKDERYDEILNEIEKFWTLKEKYKNLGFTHKRGLVVYGKPGCGKSCLLKLVMEDVVQNKDVVFIAETRDPITLTAGLRIFKEVEPDRKALVIMEDIDEGIGYSEKTFLDLLDGDNQVENVLFLATSNYINKFPPRFLRPGRFDRKLEIHNPPKAGRLAYFKSKAGLNEKDDVLEELADETQGFTFAQLREFLISVYCLGGDRKKVIERIKKGLEENLNENKDKALKSLIIVAKGQLQRKIPEDKVRKALQKSALNPPDRIIKMAIELAKKELKIERIKKGLEESFSESRMTVDFTTDKEKKFIYSLGKKYGARLTGWTPFEDAIVFDGASDILLLIKKDIKKKNLRGVSVLESFQYGKKDKKFISVSTDEEGEPLAAKVITMFTETCLGGECS